MQGFEKFMEQLAKGLKERKFSVNLEALQNEERHDHVVSAVMDVLEDLDVQTALCVLKTVKDTVRRLSLVCVSSTYQKFMNVREQRRNELRAQYVAQKEKEAAAVPVDAPPAPADEARS